MLYKEVDLLPMFKSVYESQKAFKRSGYSLEDVLECLKLDIDMINTPEKIEEAIFDLISRNKRDSQDQSTIGKRK